MQGGDFRDTEESDLCKGLRSCVRGVISDGEGGGKMRKKACFGTQVGGKARDPVYCTQRSCFA